MSENQNNTEESPTQQTMEPVAEPAKKTVAILSATPNLAKAIQNVLEPRLPGRHFIHINKMNDLPGTGDVSIASIGIPNFLKPDRQWEVITVNTKYAETAIERSDQWDMIRSRNASSEALTAILGAPQTYVIFPEGQMAEKKLEYKDLEISMLKAVTDPEKMKIQADMLDLMKSFSAF